MGGCLVVFLLLCVLGFLSTAFEAGVVPGIIATVAVLIAFGMVVLAVYDIADRQFKENKAKEKEQ